jgi:hypothetical protein
MVFDDVDRAAWADARARGRRLFIERRMVAFGLRLGVILAAWNAAVGGTLGDYDRHRLVFEGTFYLVASLACSAVAAILEWDYLRRKFEP